MKNITPKEALSRLTEGNTRFITGMRAVTPLLSQMKMGELAQKGQNPFAIVLTCSDSRSPVELIFDQGVGDLFVVRVAGNVVAPSLLASIEFAAANFATPLILVLGHTKCGAVQAAFQHSIDQSQKLPSSHLEELVGRITPAVRSVKSAKNIPESEQIQKAIEANVLRSCRLIFEQSHIVSQLVTQRKLQILGGILDISTGKVHFLDSQVETEGDVGTGEANVSS